MRQAIVTQPVAHHLFGQLAGGRVIDQDRVAAAEADFGLGAIALRMQFGQGLDALAQQAAHLRVE
ncbi:hypothetical protein D3C75_1371860 [compost metagenome]